MADNEVFRIEIPVEAIDKTEPALGQAQQKVSKFEKSMQKTEQQMNRMNRSRMQLLISAIDKASGPIGAITGKVKSLTGRSWKVGVTVLDFATKPIRAIASTLTSTIGLMTAGAGAAGGIVIPMKIAGDYEQTEIAFTTMLKSADKAKKFLAEASDFADKTPFEFPELINSSKLLMAFGFQVEKIMPMMNTIGDTSSGLGAGADGIDRITRALGQMQAKGRLQAEEMLQLQELGVPAAQILQEELGLTAEQVADIGKQSVSAAKGIQALLTGMDKRFGGMMDNQSKTALGLLSTISDTIKNKLLRNWGTGLWDGFKPGLIKIVDWLDKNKIKVTEWSEEFRKAGGKISKYVVEKLDQVKKRISALTGSTEWKNATTLGEKMKLAWDKVISEPFAEWWSGKGQAWVTKAAADMGKALGGGLGSFLMAALGAGADPEKMMKDSPFISAGATAGKAFLDAFLEAFDADKIAAKAWEAFKGAQGNLTNFAPGGKGPDFGSYATAALDAFLIYKLGKGGIKLFKGASSVRGMFKGGTQAAAAAETAAASEGAAKGFQVPSWMQRASGRFKGGSKAPTTQSVTEAAPIIESVKTAVEATPVVESVQTAVETTPLAVKNTEAAAKDLKEAASAFRMTANSRKQAEAAVKAAENARMTKQMQMNDAVKNYKTLENEVKLAAEKSEKGKVPKELQQKFTQAESALKTAKKEVIDSAKNIEKAKDVLNIKKADYNIARGGFSFAKKTVSDEIAAAIEAAEAAKAAELAKAAEVAKALKEAEETAAKALQTTSPINKSVLKTFTEFFTKSGKLTKALPVLGTTLGLIGSGATIAAAPEGQKGKAVAGEIGGWTGSLGGAALGAKGGAALGGLIGSIVPVVGTAAGAAVGGVLGGLGGGIFGGMKGTDIGEWIQEKFFSGGNKIAESQALAKERTDQLAGSAMALNGAQANLSATGSAYVGTLNDLLTSTGLTMDSQGNLITTNGQYAGSINELMTSAGLLLDEQGNLISINGLVQDSQMNLAKSLLNLSYALDGMSTKVNQVTMPKDQGFWDTVKGWFGVTPHAAGGIMTRPHMGLVAEAGPEAIIPLSGGRRQRGIDLWEQTGRALGIKPYEDGGIAGNVSTPTYVPTRGGQSKPNVIVQVQANPSYKIESATSAADILATIRQHGQEIADNLSDEIAEVLAKIFANMPEAEGV